MITRTACVGSGNIGRSWAMIFAAAGCEVALYDQDAEAPSRALAAIGPGLADLQTQGVIDDAEGALARIRIAASLEDALRDVEYVQESVVENLAVKQEIFRALDEAAPKAAVLASSVSSIPGSEFMEGLAGSARCVVAHPVNPPHLVPVVEIVPSPSTAEETLAACESFMTAIGQVPVRLSREITGYVLNRIQFALVKEALHLVQKGYVSAQGLDDIVKHGLGRRWAFMGPFETGHLNATEGLRAYFGNYEEAMNNMFDGLFTERPSIAPADIDAIASEIEQKTPSAAVPARQAWRDRRLAALSQHLRNEED